MILTDYLQQLNQLNETKGQELTVLSQLPYFRQQAQTEDNWPMVAESYWQEHLAHQHLVMNSEDPESMHRSAMLSSAIAAHQIVIDHKLDDLLGSSQRFIGRAHTYNNQHNEAKTNYQTAINLLLEAKDPRYLEVTGFLSETLVRTGEVEKGIALAYEIFDKYDTDPLALILKTVDEYRYLVWRTGIFPRLQTALEDIHAEYDKELLKSYLEKSQAMLIDKDKYAYRIKEISTCLATLLPSLILLFSGRHLPHL